MAEGKSLAELLSADRERVSKANPPIAEAYQRIIDRLQDGDAGSNSPRKGDTLPPFLLPDDQGRLVSSADFLAKGPLVVSMNRGQWCNYCRIELIALQESLETITDLGASIVAISPEIRPYANRMRERCHLTFPILCDVDNAYALSLGLAVWLGEEVRPLFGKLGLDLAQSHGNPAWMVPIPATYVVDQSSKIVDEYVNPDFRKRMEPADIIAALKSL